MEAIYVETAQSCSPSAGIRTVYGQVGYCAELQHTQGYIDGMQKSGKAQTHPGTVRCGAHVRRIHRMQRSQEA